MFFKNRLFLLCSNRTGSERMKASADDRALKDAITQLRPEMVSRRLHVYAFVRDYIKQWGASPSHGEISAACDMSRSGVRRAIASLAHDGLLLRSPGERGLSLPSEHDAAIAHLESLGYYVDTDFRTIRKSPPPQWPPGAKPTLPPEPELDYLEGDGAS